MDSLKPVVPAPVQLKMWHAPARVVRARVELSGLTVRLELLEGTSDSLISCLRVADVETTPEDRYAFPIRYLPRLLMVSGLELDAEREIVPLWRLLTDPSDRAAALEVVAGSLRASWVGASGRAYDELIPAGLASALLALEVPFVATPEAWERLGDKAAGPVIAGVASETLDGWVEIVAARPQIVETCDRVRGLFRVADTRFGIPAAYAADLDAAPGFQWVGRRPSAPTAPPALPAVPVELSDHAAADLRGLVGRLATSGTQVVAWDSGLGRRVFVLAALDALEAWPVTVVCPPALLWVWARHAQLLGRTWSLRDPGADCVLVPVSQVPSGPLPDTQTLIVDEVTAPLPAAARTALAGAAPRFDVRVGLTSTWPEDPSAQVGALALLHPAEFDFTGPVSHRYVGDWRRRLEEHCAPYLSMRRRDDPATVAARELFRASTVIRVDATDEQRASFAALAHNQQQGPDISLSRAREIAAVGTGSTLSPKAAAVAERVRAAHAGGVRRVAVLGLAAARPLLSGLLRPAAMVDDPAQLSDRGADRPAVLWVPVETLPLPDLRTFDEVLVMDYPPSMGVVADAVGPAIGGVGAGQTTVVHLTGGPDDGWVELAIRRTETGSRAGPSPLEAAGILATLR